MATCSVIPGPRSSRRFTLLTFDGHIVGSSFASGDTVVAGRWRSSPFGPFADVMWRAPDGRRTLLAPSEEALDFLDRHYSFDELARTPVRVERRGSAIDVDAGHIAMRMTPIDGGLASFLLRLRPRAVRTRQWWLAVEDTALRPIVGPVFGAGAGAVRARGRTRAGAREWYAIHDFHRAEATAVVDGRDAGPIQPSLTPARFGFSEFPSSPAVVRLTSFFGNVKRSGTRADAG
jgi:hypothetical protein